MDSGFQSWKLGRTIKRIEKLFISITPFKKEKIDKDDSVRMHTQSQQNNQ